jgi:hypothetical protein
VPVKNALILILLFLTTAVSATTYYIDPSGKDSNTGSSTSPWKTLLYACSKVTTSGDIIHVNAGNYYENSSCQLAPGVSIVGDGNTSVINTSFYAGEYHGTISLASAKGNPINGNQSISYIKIDGGNNPATTAIDVEYRSNVSIHHVTITNCAAYGIWIFNNNNAYPAAPSVAYATGNNIHDCTFENCEHRFEGQSGFLYYNNNHTNLTGNVKNLTSDWMKTFIIHDNTFTKAFSDTGWDFFLETWHYSDNSEIYNNIFNGSASLDLSDIRKGNGSWGLKVYNNSFTVDEISPDNEHSLQTLDFEGWGAIQYVYVYNNYFKNCVSPIWVGGYNQANCVYPDGEHWAIDHIYIYYNIIDNAGCTNKASASSIWLWDNYNSGYSRNHVWDNIYICNNVLTSAASPYQNQNGIQFSLGATATNVHVDNNIIKGYAWLPIHFSTGSNFNNVSVQKNLFYQNGENKSVFESAPTSKTQSDLTPANPLFVSSTDFHLQSGSPAIGAGVTLGLTTTDFAGNAVKDPPSIGAYEYGSAPPVSVVPVPVYQSSSVANASPNILELVYSLTLSNTIPSVSSFVVKVNDLTRGVNSVAISGNKVRLTLASSVVSGDVLKVSYTKPSTSPIQTTAGGIAVSIANQAVINNCLNIAPAVSITSPSANSSFVSPANITIWANPTDADGSISLVEFYNGSTKLGSKSSAPYSFSWNAVTAGTYSLTVIAYDNLNSKTTSSAISISVANPPSQGGSPPSTGGSTPPVVTPPPVANEVPAVNQPPVVTISNPVKGNKFINLSTITINAVASDADGTISKVEFYNGSVKLVELTTAPYTYTWKDVAPGHYFIKASATDNLGATTVSSEIEFEVASNIKYDPKSEFIKLYPNPSNGHFSIEFVNPDMNDKSEILITDLSGKQVYTSPILKEEKIKKVDIENSGSGMYVMMVKASEILITKKIIIK